MPDAPPARHAGAVIPEEPPQQDERAALERHMQMHIDALRALTAREQDLANVKGAVLGVALVSLAQGITEGWINGVDATVDALNQTLAQQGLPWRLIRPH